MVLPLRRNVWEEMACRGLSCACVKGVEEEGVLALGDGGCRDSIGELQNVIGGGDKLDEVVPLAKMVVALFNFDLSDSWCDGSLFTLCFFCADKKKTLILNQLLCMYPEHKQLPTR